MLLPQSTYLPEGLPDFYPLLRQVKCAMLGVHQRPGWGEHVWSSFPKRGTLAWKGGTIRKYFGWTKIGARLNIQKIPYIIFPFFNCWPITHSDKLVSIIHRFNRYLQRFYPHIHWYTLFWNNAVCIIRILMVVHPTMSQTIQSCMVGKGVPSIFVLTSQEIFRTPNTKRYCLKICYQYQFHPLVIECSLLQLQRKIRHTHTHYLDVVGFKCTVIISQWHTHMFRII